MSGDSIGKLGPTKKAYKTLVTIFSNLLKMTTVHRPLFCDFKISKMAQNKGRLAQTREISRISDKIIDLLILMRYFCTIFGFRNNLFKIRVYRLKKDLNFSFLSKISSHFVRTHVCEKRILRRPVFAIYQICADWLTNETW